MHDELQRFESIISNSLDSNQNLIITEQDKSIVGSEVDTIKKEIFFCIFVAMINVITETLPFTRSFAGNKLLLQLITIHMGCLILLKI